MVQALFATCKHILYGIENDKNVIIYSIKRTSESAYLPKAKRDFGLKGRW